MLATFRIRALGILQTLHLSIKGFGFLMLLQSQLEKERHNGKEAKAEGTLSQLNHGQTKTPTTKHADSRKRIIIIITSAIPFSFLKSPSHHSFSSKGVTLVVRSKPPRLNSDPLKHFTRHSIRITFSAAGVLCRTHRKLNCKCQSPLQMLTVLSILKLQIGCVTYPG